MVIAALGSRATHAVTITAALHVYGLMGVALARAFNETPAAGVRTDGLGPSRHGTAQKKKEPALEPAQHPEEEDDEGDEQNSDTNTTICCGIYRCSGTQYASVAQP